MVGGSVNRTGSFTFRATRVGAETALAQIIRLVARENIPLLATNGLKLADAAYLAALQRAGLRHVTFSFNGFSTQAQLQTNGRLVLQQKLQAIENLVAADLRFLLSVLLLRGDYLYDKRIIQNLLGNPGDESDTLDLVRYWRAIMRNKWRILA